MTTLRQAQDIAIKTFLARAVGIYSYHFQTSVYAFGTLRERLCLKVW
jgi:hypothetical protein